ncbi:MAG: methionine biosynthesis protein MetW [Betaproteobacteria bacterium RIFCSPLOWO2_02_FULL_65_24]|nr:MAG: methionine biosynthesis protein MetW [Betaproteobacteria bacterium RIFCSPLOWO2_02_FULL_65_24]
MTGKEKQQLTLAARPDFRAIADWVKPGSTVLDLGCGDGLLLQYLQENRQVRGYGVEISDASIVACVNNGVNVIQSDLERGLAGFDAGSFDYVILSQTLQAVRHTEEIVMEMLRVGRAAIVTFPNFGYWPQRLQVLLEGRMPVSEALPYQWYDTPNVHLFTIDDFEMFCRTHSIRIMERVVMRDGERIAYAPNLRGSLAVYRIEKG